MKRVKSKLKIIIAIVLIIIIGGFVYGFLFPTVYDGGYSFLYQRCSLALFNLHIEVEERLRSLPPQLKTENLISKYF